MKYSIEELNILKNFLSEEEYNNFINIVSSKQDLINKIYTTPIDNYENAGFTNEDLEKLKYIYQNIRYYLRKNSTYKPKLEEGVAIFVSKAAILMDRQQDSIHTYFMVGNRSYQHNIVNPFEEVARLLINASKREYFEIANTKNTIDLSIEKLELERASVKEVLAVSISKDGVKTATRQYCMDDMVDSVGEILEDSNINSNDIRLATSKQNKGVILNAIDRTIDLYHTRLDFIATISGKIPPHVEESLKTRFENKTIYAKRNIGIYEKTKKLVKESHN